MFVCAGCLRIGISFNVTGTGKFLAFVPWQCVAMLPLPFAPYYCFVGLFYTSQHPESMGSLINQCQHPLYQTTPDPIAVLPAALLVAPAQIGKQQAAPVGITLNPAIESLDAEPHLAKSTEFSDLSDFFTLASQNPKKAHVTN